MSGSFKTGSMTEVVDRWVGQQDWRSDNRSGFRKVLGGLVACREQTVTVEFRGEERDHTAQPNMLW